MRALQYLGAAFLGVMFLLVWGGIILLVRWYLQGHM